MGMVLIFIEFCHSVPIPARPSGPVADYAGIIDQETRLKVSGAARRLWVDFGIGLVVATVENSGGRPPDYFADSLAVAWGVGVNRKHTALLVVIFKDPPDIRIVRKNDGGASEEDDFISRLSGCTDIRSGAFSDGLLVLTAELLRLEKSAKNNDTGLKVDRSEERRFFCIVMLLLGLVVLVSVYLTSTKWAGARACVVSPHRRGMCGFHCRYSSGPFLQEKTGAQEHHWVK